MLKLTMCTQLLSLSYMLRWLHFPCEMTVVVLSECLFSSEVNIAYFPWSKVE